MIKKPFYLAYLCLATVSTIVSTVSVFSQTSKIAWGEEFKKSKGTAGLKPMLVDASGTYLQASSLNKQGISNNFDLAHDLVKFDKSSQQVYNKDYDYKLGDFRFNSIQALKGKLYVFYTDVDVKAKRRKIFASIIDNNTGAMSAPLKEVWNMEDETYIEAKPFISKPGNEGELIITPTPDKEKFMFVLNTHTPGGDYIDALLMDEQLGAGGKCRIKLSAQANDFELRNIYWLPSNKLWIGGAVYGMVPDAKGKKKIRTYQGFRLESYNMDGSKQRDIAADFAGKHIVNLELIRTAADEWRLLGFYMNSIPFNCISGLFSATVNSATANVTNFEATAIAGTLLGIPEDSKSPASNEYAIQQAVYDPENGGLIILAEESNYHSSRATTIYVGQSMSSYVQRTYAFTGCMLMISVGKNNKANWMKNIPKWQEEKIVDEAPKGGSAGSDLGELISSGGDWPFFSSFTAFVSNGAIHVLFNDSKENESALAVVPGKQVKKLSDFKKSGLYEVTVDLKSQAISKKLVQENADAPVPMPSYAYYYDNKIYITALTNRNLSKSDAKLGIMKYK